VTGEAKLKTNLVADSTGKEWEARTPSGEPGSNQIFLAADLSRVSTVEGSGTL
jgi:hypothetical protein